MPRFFVSSSDVSLTPDRVLITVRGDDALHITKVLRMKQGERVTACDENGVEYETVVLSLGAEVTLDVLNKRQSVNEPPYKAVVFQALVKGDRFDTVLQKSTELGACEIVPVITSRCTVKLTESDYAKKIERWQRIVYEAAKQCGRGMIPQVKNPVKFDVAVKMAAETDLALFCYEGEGTVSLPKITEQCNAPASVAVMIGPEGGFEETEVELAGSAGMKMTGLGNRILRTETAAPFVLSCLAYQYEL